MIQGTQTRLFVGGIAYALTKKEIREAFEEAGDVVDVYLPADRERGQGRNRGFCFIEMNTPGDAATAIDLFDQKLRLGPHGSPVGVGFAEG